MLLTNLELERLKREVRHQALVDALQAAEKIYAKSLHPAPPKLSILERLVWNSERDMGHKMLVAIAEQIAKVQPATDLIEHVNHE